MSSGVFKNGFVMWGRVCMLPVFACRLAGAGWISPWRAECVADGPDSGRGLRVVFQETAF